jgi:peptide/nickel transport system substrate-binding protein
MTGQRHLRAAVSAVLAMLCVAACSSAGGQRGAPGTSVFGSTSSSARTPTPGGSITIGQFSALTGFDPTASGGGGSGTAGGIELAALYDTVMRWNPDTRAFEPRTAASMQSNSDFTLWILKLKPGIKFSDGTDYDANAVKFNVERHLAPTSRSLAKPILQTFLATTTVIDPLTITFSLKQPWAGFPYMFTRDVGMIASQAAIEKAGANFNTTPGDAGAGPFMLSSFKPGESVVLKRNPTYWGGSVYLDQLTFVLLPGPDATFLGLKTGTLQAAFLRDPATIDLARTNNYSMLTTAIAAGNLALFNSGATVVCKSGAPAPDCAGQPDGKPVPSKTATADPIVRRAVAAALDPNAINQRVYQGKAQTGTALFGSDIPDSPKVPGPQYDPAQARQLVRQAMASGWDGRIRVLTANDPQSAAWGQTVKALLEGTGMQVDLSSSTDISGVIQKVQANKDFDMVNYGLGFSADPNTNFVQLFQNFYSTANRYGYSSAELDTAIDALRVANSDAKVTAAYKQIADAINRDLPFLPLAEISNAWVYTPKLHGVVLSSGSLTLLDKAWLTK